MGWCTDHPFPSFIHYASSFSEPCSLQTSGSFSPLACNFSLQELANSFFKSSQHFSFLFPLWSSHISPYNHTWPSGPMSHSLTNPFVSSTTTKHIFLMSIYSEALLRNICPKLSVGYSYPVYLLSYLKPAPTFSHAHSPECCTQRGTYKANDKSINFRSHLPYL